jgi:hypothetical protein
MTDILTIAGLSLLLQPWQAGVLMSELFDQITGGPVTIYPMKLRL